jgi:hypothetical protein
MGPSTYVCLVAPSECVCARARKHSHSRAVAVGCQITYELAETALLNEPMLLTAFYLLLFVTGMVYVRIDLSITKVDPHLHVRACAEASAGAVHLTHTID